MRMFVSCSEKGFFAEGVAILPADAVEISEELWQSLIEGQAAGEKIDFTTAIPSLVQRVSAHADKVLAAEQERDLKLTSAQSEISLWQTKLQLGIISEAERERLVAWIGYIDSINAIDLNSAPHIQWPEMPE